MVVYGKSDCGPCPASAAISAMTGPSFGVVVVSLRGRERSSRGARWPSQSTNASKNAAGPSSLEQDIVGAQTVFPVERSVGTGFRIAVFSSAWSLGLWRILFCVLLADAREGLQRRPAITCRVYGDLRRLSNKNKRNQSRAVKCTSGTRRLPKNPRLRSPKCTSYRVTSIHYPYFVQDRPGATTSNSHCFTRRSQVRPQCGFISRSLYTLQRLYYNYSATVLPHLS